MNTVTFVAESIMKLFGVSPTKDFPSRLLVIHLSQ